MGPADSAPRAWIGVDLGTQSVRAVVITDDGAVLGSGSAPLRSRRWRDGRHEQDPDQWWRATCAATSQALSEAEDVDIAAVACCGTSGTVLLTQSDNGQPPRPVSAGLMYDDSRATTEAAEVAAIESVQWQSAGLRPGLTWALPKAMWLVRRHDITAGTGLSHQVDFINSCLLGTAAATDSSNALKTGLDPVSGQWPQSDMEILGISPDLLPPAVRPGQVLGEVCRSASAASRIPTGVPVVAGMTDGCGAQLGAGVLRQGQWSFAVGTTTVLKGVSSQLLRDPSGAMYSHRAPDGNWWPGGASSAGAGALSQEFPDADYAAWDALARHREPAAAIVYPLTGMGERFPFRRADATAVTLGETGDREERYAALLQGVAFVERLCLDHVRRLGAHVDDRVTLTGGATKSRYWTQLQADVLGREVQVPQVAEGAVGMAILAASGGSDLASTARRMLAPAAVFSPREAVTRRFAAPYLQLVAALERRGWIDESLAAAAVQGAR